MKYLFTHQAIVALIVFVFPKFLLAQEGYWHVQNPSPFGTTNSPYENYNNGVSFPTDSVGYVAGACGALSGPGGGFIIKTTNEGNSWHSIKVSGQPLSVYFIDTDTGWIGGFSGYIARTTDGGRSWKTQQTGVTYGIYDIQFITTMKGWAVGSSAPFKVGQTALGVILATTDGGKTWTQQLGGEDSYQKVCFINETTGWTIGAATGTVLKTTDGGATWIPQSVVPNASTIYFVNSQEGWAGYGDLYHTSDGGLTWVLQTNPFTGNANSAYVNSIVFADDKKGWAVGSGGFSIRTTDGGTTWQKMETFISKSNNNPPKAHICISRGSQRNVFAVGTTFSASALLVITKAKQSDAEWTSLVSGDVAEDHSSSTFFDIGFADSLNGYALNKKRNGGIAQVLNTTDGGEHWRIDNAFDTSRLNAIAVPSPFQAIAVGNQGKIFRRSNSNGSLNWAGQELGDELTLNDIIFIDSLQGFIVGDNSVILHTTDGGEQWNFIANGSDSSDIQPNFRSITFINRNVGWIVGEQVIKCTHNGGISWENQQNPLIDGETLNSVKFIDSLRGWAAGFEGIIISTTNGGINWTSISNHPNNSIFNIAFIDSLHGWVVGGTSTKNLFDFTTDGGNTWQEIKSDIISVSNAGGMYGLFILDKKHIWACGGQSLIMNYEPVLTGELKFFSEIIDYGVRTLSTDNDTTIIIKNVGDGLLSVSSSAFTNGTYYSILSGSAPFTIKPDSSHQVTVRYHPTVSGILRDTLLITSDGSLALNQIAFVGRDTVVKVAEVGTLPDLIDYKKRTFRSDNDTTIAIKNIGNDQLNVSSTSFVNGIYYSVISGGAPFNLDPDSTRDITLRYHPTLYGKHNDTLVLTSNGIVTVKRIAFTGHSDSMAISVEETISHPQDFWLGQNHPNPFNGFSLINYGLPNSDQANFMVTDILGRVVYQISVNDQLSQLYFDASMLPNGLYTYSLTDKNNFQSKIMLISK